MYIPLNWQIDRVLPIGVFDFPLVSASNEQFLPLFLLAINEPSDSTLQSNLMFPIFIIEPYYFHVIPRSSHVPLVQRERKRNVSNGTELDSFSNLEFRGRLVSFRSHPRYAQLGWYATPIFSTAYSQADSVVTKRWQLRAVLTRCNNFSGEFPPNPSIYT